MKILVTGNYKDGHSGWARACQEFILVLDKVATVVPRAYKLNQDAPNVHDRVLELEQNDESNVDIVFHIGLPHNFTRPEKPAASFLFVETDNFRDSGWARHLNNSSDLVLVPNLRAQQSCIDSGVTVPIKKCYVPHSRPQNVQTIPIKDMSYQDFLFYFVGDFTTRKNLHSLLKAFHLEFTPNEPVSLVIKTGHYGATEEQVRENFGKMAAEVKASLKIRQNYKKEILITQNMSNDEIFALHNSCDCLVVPSYAECWGLPIIDALSLGKPTIANNVGGPAETSFITVQNHKIPACEKDTAFDFLNTANENWHQIDISELRAYMRWVYNNHECEGFKASLNQHCTSVMSTLEPKLIGERLIEIFKSIE